MRTEASLFPNVSPSPRVVSGPQWVYNEAAAGVSVSSADQQLLSPVSACTQALESEGQRFES